MAITINNAITPENTSKATFDDNSGLLTVTANDGYKFNNAPSYSFMDDYGDYCNGDLELSTDGKTATKQFDTSNKDEQYPVDDLNIDGTTVTDGATPTPTPTDVNVTNNVANTTCTHEYKNGYVTINIKGNFENDKYQLRNVVASGTDNDGIPFNHDFTITNTKDGATATVTFEIATGVDIDVSGDYVGVIRVTKQLDNCTGNVSDYYDLGQTVNFELKANTGTEFKEHPEYSTTDTETGDLVQKFFDVSTDGQTATLTVTLDKETNDITIYASAVAVTPVGTDYGAINVYIVTLDNLNAFSKVRFFKESSTDTTGATVEYIDLGKYVNRLKRIYTTITSGTTDVIKCGNYNTHINVFNPTTDKITLDFGTVTVPTHNNDNTDFQNEINLFVPFVGFVSVSNEMTGEQIQLQMIIDIVTGNGVYVLLHNGVMFQSGNCTPCNDVLYKTADLDLTTIGGDGWNENNLFGLEPYLFVKWYESKNPTGRNSDYKRGLISSFTGYNSFDDITPITTPEMLASEQQAIYNQLQQGVYIE